MRPIAVTGFALAALCLLGDPARGERAVELLNADERADVQARLEKLNADLLASHSATAVLQSWCDAFGARARIVARRDPGADKPAEARVRAILKVDAAAPVRYRRVALACGDQVLSEADNWYLPERLTPEMNRMLDETQTPFGVAVTALGFTRRNLTAELLVKPADPMVPREVLRQSAVLETPDGRPFSLVVETYRREVIGLGFKPGT